MVLLEILIGLPSQILLESIDTSTIPRWPVAWVEFWISSELISDNKYNFNHSSSIFSMASLDIPIYRFLIKFIASSLVSSLTNPTIDLVQFWIPFFIYLSVVHWLFFKAYLKRFSCPSFRLNWSASLYKLWIIYTFFSSSFSDSDRSYFIFSSSFLFSSSNIFNS